MKKFVSIFIAALMFFSLTGATAFAASSAEAQQKDAQKTYKCPTVPNQMKPGSIIEYIEDTTVKIIKGGFLSDDYEKYLSVPGMYTRPIKGLTVDYCDDTYIGHFKYAEGVIPPEDKPNKTQGLKARASEKSDAVILTWKQNKSALGHNVYRSTTKDGFFELIKKIYSKDTVRFNDKKVAKGETYYYKLVPFADVDGAATSVVKATVRK